MKHLVYISTQHSRMK